MAIDNQPINCKLIFSHFVSRTGDFNATPRGYYAQTAEFIQTVVAALVPAAVVTLAKTLLDRFLDGCNQLLR